MSDVLVETPIAVETKVVQTTSPITTQNRQKITYTIPHLFAISRSPLCQAPPGLPSLVELKKANLNKNARPSTQDNFNKKQETSQPANSLNAPNDSPSRKANSQGTSLNSQRQQRQNIGNAKSSSVFQFKGRKSNEADQDEFSENSEHGSEMTKGKNKTRDAPSRKQFGGPHERHQGNQNTSYSTESRNANNSSPIPEWSRNDNLPVDPIILAQQQHEFAEWKEQQKFDASNNLAWFEQLNRTDDSSLGAHSNDFNMKSNFSSEQPIDSMLHSLSLHSQQPQSFAAHDANVQNLDFILKALQNENSEPTSFSLSKPDFLQPSLADPAIIAFQDPSIFFAQEKPKSQHNHSQTSSPHEIFRGHEKIVNHVSDHSMNHNKSIAKPPKIMTSGNVPTAVLKQFSGKGPSNYRDFNSPGMSPAITPVKGSGFNLASFLESRDRLKSQASSSVSSGGILSKESPLSSSFSKPSSSASYGHNSISDPSVQSLSPGSLKSGFSQNSGLGQNFSTSRLPITGMPQSLSRAGTSLNTNIGPSQKPLSLGVGNFPSLTAPQSISQSHTTVASHSLSTNDTNVSPQSFNYPGGNGLPQNPSLYPGFGIPGHGLPNLPMNNFAPNMNPNMAFQFSPYGAPVPPTNPAFMCYPNGLPMNPGMPYVSERDSNQHFINRPVNTEDLFAAHNLSQNLGPSRGAPPVNFSEAAFATWSKPSNTHPSYSQGYSSKPGSNTQH